MGTPAAEFYRIERDSSDQPQGPRHRAVRAVGTALTGLPIPGPRVKFGATLRIFDETGRVVYETTGETSAIDALELQMLQDLVRLDRETFRESYGLPTEEERS